MTDSSLAAKATAPFESWTLRLSILAALVGMFAPLLIMHAIGEGAPEVRASHAEETVVGIAVILRATARRLLRTASSNVMRTTFATMTRASSRTFTRQLIKFTTRIFAGSVVKADGAESVAPQRKSSRRAVALGFLALALSFYGVLQYSDDGSALVESTGLGSLGLCLLAALPLLVYGVITWLAARAAGLRVGFATDLDGLVLQAYFTGSGSFLPMTTDVIYEGSEAAKARVAIWSIGGLYAVHLALALAARAMPALDVPATFFLIYCFVFAFPIRPLEGYDIWRKSRLLWLAVWTPILVSFVMTLPAEFGAVL